MSECFKIVQIGKGHTHYFDIEISHPPEAIEEIEVPVWHNPFPGGNRVKTGEVIKLHRCKLCGMVILKGEKDG